MNSTELLFKRPEPLAATAPPEIRGVARDEVRLMISTKQGHQHEQFHNLAKYLNSGDLIVINKSATLPTSMPAEGQNGNFLLNLSTNYGKNLWLTEPRWNAATPGNAYPDILPVKKGERLEVARLPAQVIIPYPGLPRLWFVQFEGDVYNAMKYFGRPIV